MLNGAHQASAGATYQVLRELGARRQHSYAALRDQGDLVVVQRFVRINTARPPVAGATALDAEATALLLRDARCLAKDWHLNIARVRHVDLSAAPHPGHDALHRELTITTEFIDGSTLGDLIEAAQPRRSSPRDPLLPYPVLVRIIIDVLAGLHALHGLRDGLNVPVGAIHGELCPANVVVGRDGLARLVNVLRKRPVRVDHRSEAMGYAAPEAFEREGTDDPRSDVYAAGAMLWEGLSGRRLYTERDPARILSRQREGEIAPPVIHPSSPFTELSDVAMRALTFDPGLRFRGAGEMATELRRIAGAHLAGGTDVAALVTSLCGDRIRLRRAELDPATSGTRRRASGIVDAVGPESTRCTLPDLELEDLAPPSEPQRLAPMREIPLALIADAPVSSPRDIEELVLPEEALLDDDGNHDLPGPRGSCPDLGLQAATALASSLRTAPPPFLAGPEISTALPLTTSKMRVVAEKRAFATGLMSPPNMANPTPGDFVIPIDIDDARAGATPVRGLLLYACAAALVLGAMGAFVALRTASRRQGPPTLALSPPPPLAAAAPPLTLPSAAPPASPPTESAVPTEPTPIASATTRTRITTPATSTPARLPARALAPVSASASASAAKPKRSIYEP